MYKHTDILHHERVKYTKKLTVCLSVCGRAAGPIGLFKSNYLNLLPIDRNCNVLPINYDPLIVMFVSIQYLMLNKKVRARLF